MSEVKLPPQKSAADTSNWDDKVFATPVSKSVGSVKKSVRRREVILNGPQRKRQKLPSPKDLGIEKSK